MNKMFYSSRELARYLEVSDTTIWLWRKSGMPFVRHGVGYHYDKNEVLTWAIRRSHKYREHIESILERDRAGIELERDRSAEE